MYMTLCCYLWLTAAWETESSHTPVPQSPGEGVVRAVKLHLHPLLAHHCHNEEYARHARQNLRYQLLKYKKIIIR